MLAGRLAIGRYHRTVEADIRGFFDRIDHDWMLKMLGERVNDSVLLGLIGKWLKAGVMEESGEVIHPVTGTPQGGIVSPVLADEKSGLILFSRFRLKEDGGFRFHGFLCH